MSSTTFWQVMVILCVVCIIGEVWIGAVRKDRK